MWPECIISPELTQVALHRGVVPLEELMNKASVTVNVKVSVFDKLVLQRVVAAHPTPPQTSAKDVATMLPAFRIRQLQVVEQNFIMQVLMSSFSAKNKKRRSELIKPNILNGRLTNPEGWVEFYKHAHERNGCPLGRGLRPKYEPLSWRSNQAMVRATLG